MTGAARRIFARMNAVYVIVSIISASAMILSNWYVSHYEAERMIRSGLYISCAFFLWIVLAALYSKYRLQTVERYLNGEKSRLSSMRTDRISVWLHLIRLPSHIFWLFLAYGGALSQGWQLYVLLGDESDYRWLHYAKSTMFNVTALSGIALVYYGLLRSLLRRSLPLLSSEEARRVRFASLLAPLTAAFVCAVLFPLLRVVWNAWEGEINGRPVAESSLILIVVIAGGIAFVAYAIVSFSFLRELRETIWRLRQAVALRPGGVHEPIPIVSRYESGQLAAVANELHSRKVWEYGQLERERTIAANVQRKIMYKGAVVSGGWRAWGDVYGEDGEISGDFYDIVPIGNGRLVVVVGTVSGSGMPAALVLSAFIGMLRYEARGGTIARIAARLNANLWSTLQGKHTIDAVLGMIDPDCGQVEIVRAGAGSIRSGDLPLDAAGSEFDDSLGYLDSTEYRSSLLEVEQGQTLRLSGGGSSAGASLWLSWNGRKEGVG